MTPLIKYSSDKRAEIICFILFGGLAKSELALLSHLVQYREGLSIGLSSDLSKKIMRESGLNESNYRTIMSRLVRKGVIKKSGKVLVLHPAFMILDSDKLLIEFN